jgi:hypothetical protein
VTSIRRAGADVLGETEVENLGGAVRRDLDVGGLQVTVDDAPLVRGGQTIGDLSGHLQRIVHRERPALDALGEIFARHQLHHERTGARRAIRGGHLLEAVDLRDVRVIERRERSGLALESREAIGIERRGWRADLERHVATELRVACAVHLAHAAGAQLREDLVGAEGPADHDSDVRWRIGDTRLGLSHVRARARCARHGTRGVTQAARVTPRDIWRSLLARCNLAPTRRAMRS